MPLSVCRFWHNSYEFWGIFFGSHQKICYSIPLIMIITTVYVHTYHTVCKCKCIIINVCFYIFLFIITDQDIINKP